MLVHGRTTGEGIVHVTSHCDAAEGTPALDHSLVLGGRRGLFLRKTISLRVSVATIEYQGRHPSHEGPLAFISACSATDTQYDSPTSIPEALLKAGYRAVVSPLVSVHVDPAFAMAMFFYAELRKEGNVGTALVRARIDLMRCKSGHSPLGLLYTCYGESGLRLDDEVLDAPLRERVLT
jgi:hypothetical protein